MTRVAMLGLVCVFLSACGDSGRDVDYYVDHPEERKETLRQCDRNPGAIGHSTDCINAAAALRKSSFSGDSMPTIK